MTRTITEILACEKLPTSTVHQARLRIFQPTRRPALIEETLDTAFGRVRVKGRLGQQHADVLEAILLVGTNAAALDGGRIKLLVDPARVRRVANQNSGETLNRVRDDLMQALVEIRDPPMLGVEPGVGHLIDDIEFAVRADGTRVTAVARRGPLRGAYERSLWRVDLGKTLCKLIAADLWLHRSPAEISRLRHGISQAVARHVLSHREGWCDDWGADALIRAVAGDLPSQSLRDRRRELAADADALARLGVRLKPGVEQKHECVEQKHECVEQKHECVEQKHDSWSKSTIRLGL